jgi:hypothetical protein
VELGENPIGQRLKGPANAVLTGKRQCQPGGKQGAENERGCHGKKISVVEGKCGGQFWQASSAISTATHPSFAKSKNSKQTMIYKGKNIFIPYRL